MGRPEPGFFTVLSIEALHHVLEQHDLTPAAQRPPTSEDTEAMMKWIEENLEETAAKRLTAKGGVLGEGLSPKVR